MVIPSIKEFIILLEKPPKYDDQIRLRSEFHLLEDLWVESDEQVEVLCNYTFICFLGISCR